MITSVLFDMDGVLLDSQPMHYDADIVTLKHYGVEISASDVEKYAGTTNLDRYIKYKEEYSIDADVDEMVAFREECIMRFVKEYSLEPIDGVVELLKSVKDTGLKTAVASSSSYDYIYAVLDRFNIRSYFDAVVSGEDMENGKPAPDIFLETARVLNSSPKECVVVEDSHNGVLAGVRAGMKVVGYVNLSSGNQDLSIATVIIDDFNQIDGIFIKNM